MGFIWLLAVAAAGPSSGQSGPFRTGIEIVYLDVTVFDPTNAIITGLTQDDFEIFDEGVKHDVAVFSDQPAPISVGVLIDASRSITGDRMTAAVAAASSLGRSLQPQDLWSVATFNSALHTLIGWRPYDATLITELKTIPAGGGTALFRSVADFARRMSDTPHRKRAMLVITDGADDVVQLQRSQRRGGDAGPGGPPAIIDYSDRARDMLRKGEVLVYGLGLAWAQSAGDNSAFHLPSLQKLAEPTGGAVAVATTMADVQRAAARLADELRQQYTLGFYPSKKPDGKYRRITVRAKEPSYRVRTRAGYLASKPR